MLARRDGNGCLRTFEIGVVLVLAIIVVLKPRFYYTDWFESFSREYYTKIHESFLAKKHVIKYYKLCWD